MKISNDMRMKIVGKAISAVALLGVLVAMPMSGSASPGSCIAIEGVTSHEGMSQPATGTTGRTTASGAGHLEGAGLSGLKLATNQSGTEAAKTAAMQVCISSCRYRYVFKPHGRAIPGAFQRCKSSCCVRYKRIC